MSDLAEHVAESIRRRRLLGSGRAVLVGVSGGPDSMVLLHLLHQLAAGFRLRLTVAHFNHQLRGAASQADERLVRRTAARLGLRFLTERAEVRQFARLHHLSVEMAARALRHEFLARTARRLRLSIIALAHHADDQVELFLLRLLRGAGTEGLAGMAWSNPSPAHPRIELVRPLLDQPKSALLRYAQQQKIPFRQDATNASNSIQRNRIRHELLPLLRRHYQPAVDQTILRVMNILGAEAEVSEQLAADWLNRKPSAVGESFDELPIAVQRRSLHQQLIDLGVAPEFDRIEGLRLNPDQPVCAPTPGGTGAGRSPRGKGFRIRRTAAGLLIVQPLDLVGFTFASNALALDLACRSGQATFAEVTITWKTSHSRSSTRPRHSAAREIFDADSVGPSIRLRHWQPGDRFQPIGMRSAVKLQDIFTNEKVPPTRRRRLVLAESIGRGIFWVEGLRMAEAFKVTKGTIRRLQWRWQRA